MRLGRGLSESPCLPCAAQTILPLQVRKPDARRGLGKGPGNFRRHMHRRRKRMQRKLGYSPQRVGAIMCQEKRNCSHRRRYGTTVKKG